MRLHDFIEDNREQILVEWEEFARTCEPAALTMDVEALRDHASQMLTVIAADLRTNQTDSEQKEKSKGDGPDAAGSGDTAAEKHGEGRAESGFTTVQMVSEYRALRASVIRLWTRDSGELKTADIEDLIRFNESVDQSLAESVVEFADTVTDAKELFLAILGHDLRIPLSGLYMSAMLIHDDGGLDEPHRTLTLRMAETAKRGTDLIGDLLDFTRSRIGRGIPIDRAQIDLTKIVDDVIDEVMAAHPDADVKLGAEEPQIGYWDASRLHQALTNLIGNAVDHGARGFPVRVELTGDEKEVAITIQNRNRGAAMSAAALDGIFDPMKRPATPLEPPVHGPTGNLGLGLYIAERIVCAHGGWIEVESSEAGGTTFTIHLPREGDRDEDTTRYRKD